MTSQRPVSNSKGRTKTPSSSKTEFRSDRSVYSSDESSGDDLNEDNDFDDDIQKENIRNRFDDITKSEHFTTAHIKEDTKSSRSNRPHTTPRESKYNRDREKLKRQRATSADTVNIGAVSKATTDNLTPLSEPEVDADEKAKVKAKTNQTVLDSSDEYDTDCEPARKLLRNITNNHTCPSPVFFMMEHRDM